MTCKLSRFESKHSKGKKTDSDSVSVVGTPFLLKTVVVELEKQLEVLEIVLNPLPFLFPYTFLS